MYNESTSSCHRVNYDLLDYKNFDSFHNTPKKLDDRRLMLNGQWPQGGCEYCKSIEDVGGTSDRMMQLTVPNLVPPELESDLRATNVTPRILEIYFDNVCNMSCLYCWNGFSSKIEQENIKFGKFDQHGVTIANRGQKSQNFAELTHAFWQWMEKNSAQLARLHVLGGEPLYQEQFYKCLDFFETNPCPNLEFNVISNLMISGPRFEEIIKKIKALVSKGCLKRFDLTCSIDCFGPEQEYVRYGLDLKQWRKNFEYVVQEPWIYLNINQTLSCLTIKTVPELLTYIRQFDTVRQINQYFSTTVRTYDFLHPKVLGTGYFDKDFEKILVAMPTQTQQQQSTYKYMQGIKDQINQGKRDQTALQQLAVYLDEIDRRRGLDWRSTFPWLVKEVDHVV